MKKILALFLVCCMLFPLYSCSSEPVPFTERLMSGKNCFMDVVEITPVGGTGWSIYLYCQCVLADGSTVWMKMDSEDYVSYFQSGADELKLDMEAKKIVFDEPVRLTGVAEKDSVALDAHSEKEKSVKLFYFESSDKDQTLNKGTRSYPHLPFGQDMKKGVPVYLEIVELKCEKTFEDDIWADSFNYLCKAKTESGEEQWVYISDSDYRKHFSSGNVFTSPAKILGKTICARDEIDNSDLPDNITDTIFSFYSVDSEQFESCKLINQPPVPFEEAEILTQPVYADFVELIPVGSQGEVNQVYYKGILTDGSTVWMKFDVEAYTTYFNKNADISNLDLGIKKLTYEKPVRIIGQLDQADVMLDDHTEEKTSVKLFYFKKFEVGQSISVSDRSGYGQPFDESFRDNVLVYADILAYTPKYSVSWFGVTPVSAYIGKAVTADGMDLWILITDEDYEHFFGSAMEFVGPVRIYGVTAYTEEEISNAEEFAEIPSLLFGFTGVVSNEFESLKTSNQPRVEYTGAEKIAQRVYVDITEIKVEYTVTVPGDFIDMTEYVCSCKTADGKTIWLYMIGNEIPDHFLPGIESEKAFTEPIRINGQIVLAESTVKGLKEAIGQDTIIVIEKENRP